MKNSTKYTVKKTKEGDYDVTLHNQTVTFSLKEVVMSFLEAQRVLKETDSQRKLDRAVLQNIKDHHADMVKMFDKLPKVKKAAFVNYITISESIIKSDLKYRAALKRHNKLKKDLADIHAVIPEEQKQLTKSERRRLAVQRGK
jgi:D-ribose pyranose/furanose isomerase RbsD